MIFIHSHNIATDLLHKIFILIIKLHVPSDVAMFYSCYQCKSTFQCYLSASVRLSLRIGNINIESLQESLKTGNIEELMEVKLQMTFDVSDLNVQAKVFLPLALHYTLHLVWFVMHEFLLIIAVVPMQLE